MSNADEAIKQGDDDDGEEEEEDRDDEIRAYVCALVCGLSSTMHPVELQRVKLCVAANKLDPPA